MTHDEMMCRRLFSVLVVSRKRCAIGASRSSLFSPCQGWLECAHIITRARSDIEFDPDNALCLCVHHHQHCKRYSPHGAPKGFSAWLEENLPGRYAVLLGRVKDAPVVIDFKQKAVELWNLLPPHLQAKLSKSLQGPPGTNGASPIT